MSLKKSSPPTAAACMLVSRPLLALLCPAALAPPHRNASPTQRRDFHQQRCLGSSSGSRPTAAGTARASGPSLLPQQMDNLFINALVQAGSCRKHQAWPVRSGPANAAPLHLCCQSRRKRADEGIGGGDDEGKSVARRRFGSAARSRNHQRHEDGVHSHSQTQGINSGPSLHPQQGEEEQDPQKLKQDELKRLVDLYAPNGGVHLETWKEQEAREAREAEEEVEASGPAPGPDEVGDGSDGDDGKKKTTQIPFHEVHRPWPNNDEVENASIGELDEMLDHEGLSPELAYEIYSSLSWPRAAYLSYQTIRNLLHCLGVVRHHDEASMLQYLAVIDDMKAAEVPIALADWNMAIQFAGKCFRKVTAQEVESALYLWRDMENKAGTKGNHVTFNILFDIAVKGGKYKLAEMVRNEMRERNLKMDRYFRTSVIMWRGLTRDGEGVRKAYKDLVEAGEIVDTAVMNCVISALVQAGEPAAAEQVFQRMKALNGARPSDKGPPRNWRQRRELGYLLAKAADHTRGNKQAHKEIQDEAPVRPDYGTYKILIEHHTITSGNIDRVTELLDEMDRVYQIPLQGDIFYTLLFGFHLHGGTRYTKWTRGRLDSTWRAFMMSLEEGNPEFFLRVGLVNAAILAFSKCTGQEKTMQVWEEIRARWNPPRSQLDQILKRLTILYPPSSV